MNNASIEFNTQLELDVLLNGLTELTQDYVKKFDKENLTDVIIPEGVKSIGDSVFWCYKGITVVKIPNSVISIGNYAFMYCSGLTSVTIGNSVTSIDKMAFYNCSGLTHMTIPDSVTSIGISAFAWCRRLTDITFEGKTLDEVKAMTYYPWDISPKKIHVQVIPDLL